jgi:effector-binding domain-containing protein
MITEIELVDLQEQPAAVVRGHVKVSGIREFLGAAFGEVLELVTRQQVGLAGAPFGRYQPTKDGGFDVEAGFPVHGEVRPEGRVVGTSLPGGRAGRILHVGSYDTVAGSYGTLTDWLIDNGYVVAGTPWECYLDGPEVPEPRTEIFVPCHEARPLD